MHEALLMGEGAVFRGPVINFDAAEPSEVIDWDHVGEYIAVDNLFRFLTIKGDRRLVAPRAKLGIARTKLLRGAQSSDKLIDARFAYSEFFNEYPNSELVFDALCEQALSSLLGYRGKFNDIAVLLDGRLVIDRASLYVDDRPERIDRIARYRQMMTHWAQDRDVVVAKWYSQRVDGLTDLAALVDRLGHLGLATRPRGFARQACITRCH